MAVQWGVDPFWPPCHNHASECTRQTSPPEIPPPFFYSQLALQDHPQMVFKVVAMKLWLLAAKEKRGQKEEILAPGSCNSFSDLPVTLDTLTHRKYELHSIILTWEWFVPFDLILSLNTCSFRSGNLPHQDSNWRYWSSRIPDFEDKRRR